MQRRFLSPPSWVDWGREGFTLIEILLVVSLLGLLTLVITNSFGRLREYNEIYSSAVRLARDIRMCQNISMEEGITTRILLDFVSNRYHLIKVERLPVLYKTVPLEGSVSFSWTNFKRYKIEFDPVGCPDMSDVGTPDKGGTIALKNRNNRFFYIIITPVTGYVRISESPPR